MKASGYGLFVTFFRSFDVVKDRSVAIKELTELGVSWILSASSKGWQIGEVAERVRILKEDRALCSKHALKLGNRTPIKMLPGGGIRHHNAKDFLACDGINFLHASCRGPNSTIDTVEIRKLTSVMKYSS